MNYTQSFEEFSKSLSTMDLALYAGLGLIIWVLFKDKLSPVQEFLSSLIKKTKQSLPTIDNSVSNKVVVKEDHFFDLITSWKQTRDLAVACGCNDAIKSMDQMFPHLSPQSCGQEAHGDVKK